MENQNYYSKELVFSAINLVAKGCVQCLPVEEAKEKLSELPEELRKYVMAATLAALRVKRVADLVKFLKED